MLAKVALLLEQWRTGEVPPRQTAWDLAEAGWSAPAEPITIP
jgi:hypothetical protein